jgi:molybdenum cofactor guanylyltransferase
MTNVSGQDGSPLTDKSRWASLTVGCVLAGGRALRMGGHDKALLAIGGKPMLRRAIDRLAPQVGTMILNANGDPARFSGYDLAVVSDPVPGFAGPLAGILAGMRWAQAHRPAARWIVSVPTDTPFFPDDLVIRLVGAVGHHETMIALAKSGNRIHPVFGLWPVALADDLEASIRDEELRKVKVWARRHPVAEVIFHGPMIEDIEIDPFFNVNSPEDVETAEVIAAELDAERVL